MKTTLLKNFIVIVTLLMGSFTICTAQNMNQNKNKPLLSENYKANVNYKVTFIELGSVRCIPCQKMQPIMKSIEEKYSKDVKVVFYDVWTADGKPYAQKYNINLIPTQVFLDENGKEFFRHEGFFPEEELVKILKLKGVKEH